LYCASNELKAAPMRALMMSVVMELRNFRISVTFASSPSACRNASFFECFPYVCPKPVLVK
jgi:hypothetical protein